MPAFSLTPLGAFPPPAPSDFPQSIQWQFDGVDVGDRSVNTVNITLGAAFDMSVGAGEDSNILTIVLPFGTGV